MDNAESVALIRRFLEACVRADADEFAGYFTDEAVWWNAPWAPVKGREAIRETLHKGAQRMIALPWEVRHILGDGQIVFTERVDRFQVAETVVRVPCMGGLNFAMGRSLPGAITGTCGSSSANCRSRTRHKGKAEIYV